MNDNFREFKRRMRELEARLANGGTSHIEFAQAVSRVRRAARHGDRTRDPTPELRALLEKAELLSRAV